MKRPDGLVHAALVSFALMFSNPFSEASIAINIGGGEFRTANSQPLAAGSLLQLVNLGADGVFNELVPNDGGSQWVSGDDTLLSAPYTTGNGAAGDFPSTDAFDLFKGSDEPGTLNRVFEFATNVLPLGAGLGIRWFPNVLASDFASTTLEPGQSYGQFTRLQNPIHNGTVWIVPSDGAIVTFDPLLTQSFGGLDPNAAGVASFGVVPEPSASGLSMLGSIALLLRRRRKNG